MFRLLQVIGALVLLILTIVVFKKVMHKSKAYVAGMCIIVFLSSIISGVILDTIPMPTQEVRITALQEKNDASQGNMVALHSMIVDGKEYNISEVAEGNWIYSKDDLALIWVDESDERWNETISNEIVIDVPVGAGRTLVFSNGLQYGKVSVSYGAESKTYDLYKSEDGVRNVYVADSNAFYDNFIKLLRLAGYGLGIVCAIALAFLIVKKLKKEILIKIMCCELAVISTLTFYINMKISTRSGSDFISLVIDFNKSFGAGNFILAIILVPLLYKAYLYCAGIYTERYTAVKSTVCIAVPAGFFSIFMVIGSSFVNVGNLHSIFEDDLQLLKSLFALMGYFPICFFGISWIFKFLDGVDVCKASDKKYFKPIQLYFNAIKKKPFITAFVTLLIIYIPYIIVSYPAIFMGDCPHQFRLVFDKYGLDNAHPIAHTLLLKLCVKIGVGLFGSVNIGAFIYSLLQLLFVISVVSLLVKLLLNVSVSPKAALLLIIYYAIQPRIQNYMMLITKDVINATFLLVFIMALYILFTQKKTPLIYVVLAISDVGALLFRHDSSYIIVISLVLMLLLIKNFRKQIVILASGTFVFAFLWNNVLLKQLDIPSVKPWGNDAGGILSSIMLQQTARCVRDVGDQITEEEMEGISAYLNYDDIATMYDPIRVDGNGTTGVASTVKFEATADDWKIYQNVWLKMLFKYPDIYVEATLHNKFEFFYPSSIDCDSYRKSIGNMDRINNELETYMPVPISHPESLGELRSNYESLRESIFFMPVFNAFTYTSTFVWCLLIWFSYCIYRNNKEAIAIMMPLLIMVFVLIAGPTNGRYFRYVYPYALCLPAVITLGLYHKQAGKKCDK